MAFQVRLSSTFWRFKGNRPLERPMRYSIPIYGLSVFPKGFPSWSFSDRHAAQVLGPKASGGSSFRLHPRLLSSSSCSPPCRLEQMVDPRWRVNLVRSVIVMALRLFVLAALWANEWSMIKLGVVLVASLIPFGPFVIDRHLRSKPQKDVDQI